MHPNGHCSTICNSQDMETTCMSIDRVVDKEDGVYIHNGILAIKRKEIMTSETTWMDSETIMLSEVKW